MEMSDESESQICCNVVVLNCARDMRDLPKVLHHADGDTPFGVRRVESYRTADAKRGGSNVMPIMVGCLTYKIAQHTQDYPDTQKDPYINSHGGAGGMTVARLHCYSAQCACQYTSHVVCVFNHV